MLRFISKEDYGLYILCVDFLSWVTFLDFGTSKVMESKTGHLLAKGDEEGINKAYNSSFFFQIGIGILLIPIYYLLVRTGIKQTQVQYLNLIIILFAISAGLNVFKSLFSALIIASRKVYVDNSIQIFINLLNYALVLLLTPFVGVMGLAIISVAMVILTLIRSVFRTGKLFPFLKTSPAYFDKEMLKSLFANGIYFSLGSMATIAIAKIDSFIIGRNMGLEIVASYYITIKLFVLVQKLIQILYNNYRPYVAIFYGKEEYGLIRNFYETTSWMMIGFSSFAISIAMIVNNWFVDYWVGADFFLSKEFSFLFGIYILLDLCTLPSRVVLTSSLFKIRNQSFARIFEGALRIFILLILFSTLKADSIPFSSVISTFVFGSLFFHLQLRHYFAMQKIQVTNFIFVLVFVIVLLAQAAYFTSMVMYFPFGLLVLSILTIFYMYQYQWEAFAKVRTAVRGK